MLSKSFQIIIDYFAMSSDDNCPSISIDDNEDFTYGTIFNMYKDNIPGYGLQLSKELEKNRDLIAKMCSKISQIVYETKKEIENAKKNS